MIVAADGQEQDFAHCGRLRGHNGLVNFRRKVASYQAELLGHDLAVRLNAALHPLQAAPFKFSEQLSVAAHA